MIQYQTCHPVLYWSLPLRPLFTVSILRSALVRYHIGACYLVAIGLCCTLILGYGFTFWCSIFPCRCVLKINPVNLLSAVFECPKICLLSAVDPGSAEGPTGTSLALNSVESEEGLGDAIRSRRC